MTLRERIEAMYGEKALSKSAMRLRGGDIILERMLRGRDYKVGLEIGTHRGVTSAVMAQHCERVITIDLKHGQLEATGSKWDRAAFWRSLGIRNIELHRVQDNAAKAALISGLAFDFAFIDGAHTAPGVRFDFDLVKRCGCVLFHDYDASERPALRHVYDFVNALPDNEVEIVDIFAMWRASK